MGALSPHLRAELRTRWPAWLAVVLLIGLVGGMVLGAAAGARRTATAFDRMLDDTETADVLVNPDRGTNSALRPRAVAALPGVERIGVLDGVGAVLFGADGRTDMSPLMLRQRDARVLIDFDRPRVVSGSLFDPDDPDQVMVTDDIADRNGLEVGDSVRVGTLDMESFGAWEESGAEGEPPLRMHELRLTAIVVIPDGVVDDEAFSFGWVMLPKAFGVGEDLPVFYFGIAVELADDSPEAVRAFRTRVHDLAPGEPIEFKTAAATSDTVARGTRPHVVALLAFVLVLGLAGTVVCSQALNRLLQPLDRDAGALQAIGVTRRRLRRAARTRAALVAVAGAAVAVAVAVAVSPAFPLGVASRAEVSPGVQVDAAILLPGATVLVLALVVSAAVASRRLGVPARAERERAGRPLQRVGRATSSPVASTGIRAAVASSSGRHAASARAALAGLAVAVGAVVAAMTFGANLIHLVTTPADYGWSWGALVYLPDDISDRTEIIDRAGAEPNFASATVITVDQVEVDGERVPAIGIDTTDPSASLTIVDGRLPRAPDEVALGRRTMAMLGVGVGDTVRVGADTDTRELDIVGQAVFPGLGTYPGADRTELGKGVLADRNTLSELGEGFGFPWLAITAPDPPHLDAGLDTVMAGFEEAVSQDEMEVLTEPQRPSDIQSLLRVRRTPLVIAGLLALLAGVAFAFVLVAGVRSRRRELALLKTFGFRSRDVAGTIVWQATVTGSIAVGVGVPIGVVVGRLTWSSLAETMGVASTSRVPISLLVVPVAVLVVANAVAAVPGWLAARTRPAVALRSE